MKETNTYIKLKNKPQDNFPQYYVIHCTGGSKTNPLADTSNHTANGMEKGHLALGWEGLGYQYAIHKDGEIWKGRPEHYHGAHVSQQNINFKSIGICLVGNFDATLPTKEQEDSLKKLILDLQTRYGKLPIVPHRYFLGTPPTKSCYGKLLADDYARNLVEFQPETPKSIILKRLNELTQLVESLKVIE